MIKVLEQAKQLMDDISAEKSGGSSSKCGTGCGADGERQEMCSAPVDENKTLERRYESFETSTRRCGR